MRWRLKLTLVVAGLLSAVSPTFAFGPYKVHHHHGHAIGTTTTYAPTVVSSVAFVPARVVTTNVAAIQTVPTVAVTTVPTLTGMTGSVATGDAAAAANLNLLSLLGLLGQIPSNPLLRAPADPNVQAILTEVRAIRADVASSKQLLGEIKSMLGKPDENPPKAKTEKEDPKVREFRSLLEELRQGRVTATMTFEGAKPVTPKPKSGTGVAVEPVKADSLKAAVDALQEALKTADPATRPQIQKALDRLKEAQ